MLLRACKVALGFNLYDQHVDAISREFRKAEKVLDSVLAALISVIGFLRDACGIYSPRVLPYFAHLIPLIEAVRRRPSRVSVEERHVLLTWFWTANYASRRFSPEQLLSLLDRLTGEPTRSTPHSFVRSNVERLPSVFNFRNARCRMLALHLAELAGSPAPAQLGLYGADTVPHFLYGHVKVPQDWFESPANRIVVDPARAPDERKRLRLACERRPRTGEDLSVLARHAISLEAADALAQGNYSVFYSHRLQALENLEKDFAKRVGVISG